MRVIHDADAAAQRTRSPYIGTDHLLLALVTNKTSALNLIHERNNTAVGEIVPKIEKLIAPTTEPWLKMLASHFVRGINRIIKLHDFVDDLSVTPRARHAVFTATDLAITKLNWNGGRVGCEHLLFALLSDSESVAYQVLANVGIAYDDLLALARRHPWPR